MVSYKDILLGVAVMLVWAGNGVVIKAITLELPPFTGLAIRFAIALIFFLPFLRWPGKEQFKVLFQICFFMSICHWGSLIWAIDKLDASMAAILMQLQVIFAVLIGRFFFNEKFGWQTGTGITLGILGVIIIVGLPENPPALIGVLGMCFSMLTLAISYARMKAMHGVSSINYIAHLHLIGILPAFALMFIFENPRTDVDWNALNLTFLIPAFLYQALVMSASHMLWQRLIARNSMSSGMPNLTLLLPVFGVIMAMIFLGDTITATMIAGGLLTMIGVGIVVIRKQKRIES